LGAVYNNWGNWYSLKEEKNATISAENEKKSKGYWEKAIIYLEKADAAKGCDKGVMFNLKRLYYMTEKKEKGDAMKTKMASGCK
ncbi:MAG: hypothetical protein IAF38_09080, partial [Bacteroidia bacterium]|nr:hypothetical protein [Bacteroidia bacterium]